MLKQVLTYGAIAGAIVGVPMFVMAVALDGTLILQGGMVLGYTLMLIALSTVFVGVKRYRDIDRGGVIGFWRALGMGLAISAVGGIVYVIAWEAALALMHNDFIDTMTRYQLDRARTAGASAAKLAQIASEADMARGLYANPLLRVAITFSEMLPVGALVSLVSAGLLSFRRFLPVARNVESRAA
ncbi:MAG: DUF4199 domain-containing protein [Pseudomonadota bacterium]